MIHINSEEYILKLNISYSLKQSDHDLEKSIEYLNNKYGSNCYRITRSGIDPDFPGTGTLLVEVFSDVVTLNIAKSSY